MDLERRVDPALARANGRLRLDHDQRDAVDEQHEVGALLGGPGAEGELGRDDVLVPLEVVEVDQPDGDVLAVLAEGHRPLAREPGGELLVGLDEAVAADAHQDGAELVEDVVGAVGLRGDLRVQPDQRLAQVILDEDLVRLPRKVLRREEVPAETGDWPCRRARPAPTAVWCVMPPQRRSRTKASTVLASLNVIIPRELR